MGFYVGSLVTRVIVAGNLDRLTTWPVAHVHLGGGP